jgi:hypothetical protein
LQAESSTAPKKNTKTLISIALSLLPYCGANIPARAAIATDIEKSASDFLGRIASNSGNHSVVRHSQRPRDRTQTLDASARLTPTIGTLALISNAVKESPNHLPAADPAPQHRDVISQLSPTEGKIVGAWSWTYIEGVGRIIFTADHRVRAGFPPDDKDGRRIGDDEFDVVQAGTWHLEGEVLITEMDNSPLLNILEHLDPSNRPALEKKVERWKIVKIDGNKIVFDNGYSFDRVKR